MATIFSKIAAGEIPSYKIAADDRHYAFLDINPVAPGHVLVIPRREVSYIFDLTDEEYREAVMPCKRIGIAVIGLEVPHAHIHLIPLNTEKDMDFSSKMTLPAEEMERIATAVSAKFDEMN